MRANRRALARLAAYLLVCFVVALAACSANAGFGPFKPVFSHRQLAPLTIPHVRRLAAFSRLAPSTDPDSIYSLSTFVPAGQTDLRVFLTVDGAVYATHLDGSGAGKINLPYPCYSPGISANGSWLACPNETDQSHDAPEIQVASLSPGTAPNVSVSLLAGGGFYLYPTWSPDGTNLAILHDQDNTSSGCAIGLYSSTPPYQSFKHLADVANSAHFINGFGGCTIGDLTWSPDGRWLAFLSQGEIFLVATTALLHISSTSSGAASATVDLPDTELMLAAGDPSSGGPSVWRSSPTWDPATGFLTYLSIFNSPSLQEEIVTYDPVHAKQQVELRLPLASATASGANAPDTLEHLSAVAWTPYGQQMLLVVDQRVGCVDCAVTYPSDVYLYTPSL